MIINTVSGGSSSDLDCLSVVNGKLCITYDSALSSSYSSSKVQTKSSLNADAPASIEEGDIQHVIN